jgi:hypothetical protein
MTMEVVLRKGKETIRLTDPIQIAAFKNGGWEEVVKPTKKHETKD